MNLSRVSSLDTYTVACCIPTRNGFTQLPLLLDSLNEQIGLTFDTFVIDSSSTDGTALYASSRVTGFHSIPVEDFNHGESRNLFLDFFSGYDIYIFMTQDIILATTDSLHQLIQPFYNEAVSAVCGRQIPHMDALPSAAHARYYNYPNVSSTRSIHDAPKLGLKTAFLSNSFAAYRYSALSAVGGFPPNVILGEDMYVAAKFLLKGQLIAYQASAICYHSHNFTPFQEFKRYFDIGVFHSSNDWISHKLGGPRGEGLAFLASELRYLLKNSVSKLPISLLQNALKLIGYRIGFQYHVLPNKLRRLFSSSPQYFK
jgi:rhamnosyltransferase